MSCPIRLRLWLRSRLSITKAPEYTWIESPLRYVAEEWEVHIALDLTGAIDPRWEAEAAILRLGERLRLVRFAPPSSSNVPAFVTIHFMRGK